MGIVKDIFSPPKPPTPKAPPPPPPPPGTIIQAFGRTLDLRKPDDKLDYENLQRREAEKANREAKLTAPRPVPTEPQAASEDPGPAGPSPEQKAQEEASKEARRAVAGAIGRRSTLLTGGLGVTEPAPVRRRGLLGTG